MPNTILTLLIPFGFMLALGIGGLIAEWMKR